MRRDVTAIGSIARRAIVLLRRDRSGARELVVVALASLVLAAPGWLIASAVGGVVRDVLATGDCGRLAPGGALMHVCATGFAAATLVIPTGWLVVLFRARTWLAARIRRAAVRAPRDLRYLVAPAFAGLSFLVPWAFIHADTGLRVGIVPQWAFPALIATLGHATERYGHELRGSLAEFFARRDRLPLRARSALAIGIPLAVAVVITSETPVSLPTLKEQVVALVAFVCGYLALAPARGALASSLRSALLDLRPPSTVRSRAMVIASRLRGFVSRGAGGAALLVILAEPARAYACSSHYSCTYEPGYATVMGVAGGLMALATSALTTEVASPMLLAPDARAAKTSTTPSLMSVAHAIPWLPLGAVTVATAIVLGLCRVGAPQAASTEATTPIPTTSREAPTSRPATASPAAGPVRVTGRPAFYTGTCDQYQITFVWVVEGVQRGNFMMRTAIRSEPFGAEGGPYVLTTTSSGSSTWDPATGRLTVSVPGGRGGTITPSRAEITQVLNRAVTGDTISVAPPRAC